MMKGEVDIEAWIENQWNEMGKTIIYTMIVLTSCVFCSIYAFGCKALPLLVPLVIFYVIPLYWCSVYGSWKSKHTHSSKESAKT